MAPTTVRRNLFHHHLSRRPASSVSSATTTSTTAATGSTSSPSTAIAPTNSSKAAQTLAMLLSTAPLAAGDIVIRDKNGGYKVDVPVLPPGLMGDDADEGGMEGIEDGGPSGGAAGSGGGADEGEMSGKEKEKIEASIVEMMCRNRSRQINNEPSEIFLLIQQSLQNKVAGLEEDKWMYEEEEIHV